jgi:hypothetical protein
MTTVKILGKVGFVSGDTPGSGAIYEILWAEAYVSIERYQIERIYAPPQNTHVEWKLYRIVGTDSPRVVEASTQARRGSADDCERAMAKRLLGIEI